MPLELDLEIDNRSGVELDTSVYEKVEEYILITLQQENVLVPCEISFSLVIPEEIQELNAEYRNIDKETDVLSFPMLEFPEDEDMLTYETGIPVMLGDIVISTKRAAEQAEEYGHSLEREICYLSVHSVLHLLGYDHMEEDEKRVMRAREKAIMGDD
ncbi:rRNA maturation RNase YbeY [Eubacterium limosum]|uniref:rRNA maturation RNase YbeY n=1 Tax=Eubacterium limosum TaxID=1736 RepID=UPI0037188A27